MGLVSPELSLDFRPNFVPKTISEFLKEVSMIGIGSEKVSKVDEFVKRLQDEMRKIDAFKRELPLCMLLLNDAIITLKEEMIQCRATNVQPVLEEFIPLKGDCDEKSEEIKKEKECRDKKNWMSSVQLWNTDSKHNSIKNEEANGSESRGGGGRAIMPFKAYSGFSVTMTRKEDKEELPVHGLSFLTRGIKISREELGSNGSKLSCSHIQWNSGTGLQQQIAQKQRRCWSPELHRRFVSALQQLGGSQVATPKQIRELMQVEGLTNDEVKSHLQKYRLHTRRVPASKANPTNPSVVVYPNLWMSQDESSKASSSQSGSPQGPFQLAGTGGRTSSTGDDSMDATDDDKSESNS